MHTLAIEMLDGHGPVYGPSGTGHAPGIVVVHGGEGPMAGWSHRFAAILAAHGFFALPVSYGQGDFFAAGPIRDVALESLRDAGAALMALPRVDLVGGFGWSKGAEQLLLLASLLGAETPFAAIAAHAAPDRVTAAFDPAAFRAGAPALATDPDAPRAWTFAGEDARLAPGAEIGIERYPGPVFLSVGDADEVWDHHMTLALAARLAAAGRPADLFVAQGEGHALSFQREPELWFRLAAFFGRHLGHPDLA